MECSRIEGESVKLDSSLYSGASCWTALMMHLSCRSNKAVSLLGLAVLNSDSFGLNRPA